MRGFVIDGVSGTRTGAAKLIDTYPGKYLVIGPWVVVRPVVEFFVEPGKQGNRRVVECVAYCAGFGRLEQVVAWWLTLIKGKEGIIVLGFYQNLHSRTTQFFQVLVFPSWCRDGQHVVWQEGGP